MTKVSKTSAEKRDIGVGDVYEQIVDGYEITILDLREDVDMAPLLKGLPDDRCTSRHWGYVVTGKLTFTFADHTETFEAGDCFYVGRGHSPAVVAGTEYVMFSPEDEIAPVTAAIDRNLAALQSA